MTAPGVYTPHQGQDKPLQWAKQVVELPEVGSEAERALAQAMGRRMQGEDRWDRFPGDRFHWIGMARDALAALREIAKEAE